MSQDIKHLRCGWIEPEPNTNAPDPFRGKNAFLKFAPMGYFHVIHPGWIGLNFGDPSFPPVGVGDIDDRDILDTADHSGVAVWPLVNPSFFTSDVDQAERTRRVLGMHRILKDKGLREAHAAGLVRFADEHKYAGLDIDFEHLDKVPPMQGGLPLADLRSFYNAYLETFAAQMTAKGMKTSAAPGGVVIPEITAGYYSYVDIAKAVDAVHVQAYDLHNGVGHVGPACPTWWLNALMDHAALAGDNRKFLFGMPNYALTGPNNDAPISLAEAAASCSGHVVRADEESGNCPFRSQDPPPFPLAPGDQPHCTAGDGSTRYYDDVASFKTRIDMIRARGFGGITYWHLGDELDGFLDAIKARFPDDAF